MGAVYKSESSRRVKNIFAMQTLKLTNAMFSTLIFHLVFTINMCIYYLSQYSLSISRDIAITPRSFESTQLLKWDQEIGFFGSCLCLKKYLNCILLIFLLKNVDSLDIYM